jgi:hypothetical protein
MSSSYDLVPRFHSEILYHVHMCLESGDVRTYLVDKPNQFFSGRKIGR